MTETYRQILSAVGMFVLVFAVALVTIPPMTAKSASKFLRFLSVIVNLAIGPLAIHALVADPRYEGLSLEAAIYVVCGAYVAALLICTLVEWLGQKRLARHGT